MIGRQEIIKKIRRKLNNFLRTFHALGWKKCFYNDLSYDYTPKLCENDICYVFEVIFYVKFEMSCKSSKWHRVCHKISCCYEGWNVTHMKSRRWWRGLLVFVRTCSYTYVIIILVATTFRTQMLIIPPHHNLIWDCSTSLFHYMVHWNIIYFRHMRVYRGNLFTKRGCKIPLVQM